MTTEESDDSILGDHRVVQAIEDARWNGYQKGRRDGYAEGVHAAQQLMNQLSPRRSHGDAQRATPIRELEGLQTRVSRVLYMNGIYTVGDALDKWHQLGDISGFGGGSYVRLSQALAASGFTPPSSST